MLKINFLKFNKALEKYYKNSLWILIEKSSKIFIYFFMGVLLARYLGPENFGNYSLVITVISISSGVAAFGLNGLLVKEFVARKNEFTVFYASLIVRGVGVIIGFLLSITSLLYFFQESLSFFIVLVVSIAVSFSLVQIVDFYFESKLQTSITARYKVIGYSIGFILKLTLLINNYDYIFIVLAHVAELFFIFVLGYFAFFNKINCVKSLNFSINYRYVKNLFKNGFPLLLSSIAVLLYMKVDQFFIYEYLNPMQVGFYSASTRLCEGLFLISAIIIPSFFPSLIRFNRGGEQEKYKKYFQNLFFFIAFLGIILSAFVSFFSKEIIDALYGEQYASSYKVLMIFVLSLPIIYIGELVSRWLIIEDMVVYSVIRHLLGLFINIVLNILLIPKYGIEGAAVASVVAYFFAVFVFLALTKRTREFYKLIFTKGII